MCEEIISEFQQIEIFTDYSLINSKLEIKQKLLNHSVMLVNLEEKFEQYRKEIEDEYLEKYDTHINEKLGVYLSLIQYREFAKNHLLILLCNSSIAKLILHNDQNLSSFARNYIYVKELNNFETNKKDYMLSYEKIN